MTAMKGIRSLGAVLFLALACALLAPAPSHATVANMMQYCVIPPYVQTGTMPNILIMMDNSEINGTAVYPVNGTYGNKYFKTAWDLYGVDETYTGYFNSNIMYRYDGSKFVPANPTTNPTTAIFDGNMLNWAATSRYDLIQAILLGGVATSRQNNVNTLIGYNSGTWATRYYVYYSLTYTSSYNGASQYVNVCEIKINENNRGDMKISDDTSSWYAGHGYYNSSWGFECGLLRGRGPKPDFRHSYFAAADASDGTDYAQAGSPAEENSIELLRLWHEGMRLAEAITKDAPLVDGASAEYKEKGLKKASADSGSPEKEAHWITKKAFGLLNMLFAFLGPSEAEASPFRIITPNNNASYPLSLYENFVMVPTVTPPTETYIEPYVWSMSAGSLPPGLSLDTSTGSISGAPTAPGTYPITLRVNDGTTPPTLSHSDSINITITVTGTALSITSPGTWFLPDGVKNDPYRYLCIAAGGSGNYSWSATNLPPDLSIDPITGIISGTIDNVSTTSSDYWPYPIYITVSDGYASVTTSGKWMRILPGGNFKLTAPTDGEALPGAVRTVEYVGYECLAVHGSGTYTWDATGLPAGLSIGSSTGVISGTPTAAAGTYTVTIKVSDNGGSTWITRTTSITVSNPTSAMSSTFNIRVCVGDYVTNCNNTAGSNALKSGILQEFYGQARFGFMDFSTSENPSLGMCILDRSDNPASMSNFYTNVQNAIPVGVTKLVDGMHRAMVEFRGDGTCDPYEGVEPCTKSYVLLVTGGEGANVGTPLLFSGSDEPPQQAECTALTYNLSKNACYGYENDLRINAPVDPDNPTGLEKAGTQNVSTFIVNAMGSNGAILSEAANNSGGLYYEVTDPGELKDKLKSAFQDIIKRAASGTAASVLASGEGSGANLIQAVYYPKRRFKDSATNSQDEIGWIGRLSNFWYYVDPRFTGSNMREDTDRVLNDPTYVPKLNLINDYVAELYYDSDTEKVMAILSADTDGTGDADVTVSEKEFEKLGSIWEAGELLWKRAASTRTIYANITNTPHAETAFTTALSSDGTVRTLLQAADAADALNIINFTRGEDVTATGFRDRMIKVDLNGDGDTLDTGELFKKVWKLGDVVNSTPRIVSFERLNTYDEVYNDSTYATFYQSADYQNRGMVFAGGNDGMLHAFKLGKLELDWEGQGTYEMARITGDNLGREQWAFIPKNALPYLRYIADSDYETCHVFTVDLSPYIFDASIAKDPSCSETDYWDCDKTAESWRTILIGGMRTGGACKQYSATNNCTDDMISPAGVDSADCVNTPLSGVGYSSYFALDITDPENPDFLWEFSNPNLGFATTGPAVIRISPKSDINGDSKEDGNDGGDPNKNGRWYAVFGSGPTGPILNDQISMQKQFMGFSDQNLKLFVLDIKTGELVGSIDTGVQKAYAGSMVNVTNDSDFDYQDDSFYHGYVKKAADGTWTQGGVGRLLTNEDMDITNWSWTKVIDNIGPVTSSISKLQNNDLDDESLWLFFGTGRFFYKSVELDDDPDNYRHLFGVRDVCYIGTSYSPIPYQPSCSDANTLTTGTYPTLAGGELTDMTDLDAIVDAADPANAKGWFIRMDGPGDYTYADNDENNVTETYDAERVITDPLASISGVVYFTSYKPYTENCAIGGKSFIWAVKYDTGSDAAALLRGTALIQVSTGAIEKIDLSTAFTDADNRKSGRMEGVPPTAQGFSLFLPPPPDPRVLQIKEK